MGSLYLRTSGGYMGTLARQGTISPRPTAARVAHPRPTPFDATRVMFLSPAARKGALANLVEATGLLSDLALICLEYYFCKEKIYATGNAFGATLYSGLVITWGHARYCDRGAQPLSAGRAQTGRSQCRCSLCAATRAWPSMCPGVVCGSCLPCSMPY